MIDRAEIIGFIKYTFLRRGYFIYLITPKSLKKYTTLFGNADKDLVKQNIEAITGLSPKDDNEADSIALCLYGKAVLLDNEKLDYMILRPLI